MSVIESIRSWLGWGSIPVYNTSAFFTTGADLVLGTQQILGYTPVYRCSTLISNDLARTPAEFMNPELERLWRQPNKYQSGWDFRRSLTQQAVLFGNAFAYINRRRGGGIYELVPLAQGSVSLDLSKPEPVYHTAQFGDVAPADIIHLKASLLDGLWAASPINLCKTALDIAVGQEATTRRVVMAGGGVPKMVFMHPQALNQAARQAMQSDYMKNHSNAADAYKPIVLAENMRLERIQSMFDADGFKNAKTLSIQDVSRIFGVPLPYLSETQGNVYGSLEWLTRMYMDSCLEHWFQTWSAEFEMKLGEAPDWDRDLLVRPSLAETFTALRTGVEAGVLTQNEAREFLDLEEVEGGDEFLIAKNLGLGAGASNEGIDTSMGSQGDITENGTN